MPLTRRTKRWLIVIVGLVAVLLVGGFAFVSYFMHAVYEPEVFLGEGDIPAAVRASFARLFPDATDVIWEFDEDLFEAEFRWPGQRAGEASFAADGTWIRTVTTVAYTNLPPAAQAYLQAQEGYRVTEVERIETPGPTVRFEAQLESPLLQWDCLFDAAGNLISKTRDGPVLE